MTIQHLFKLWEEANEAKIVEYQGEAPKRPVSKYRGVPVFMFLVKGRNQRPNAVAVNSSNETK